MSKRVIKLGGGFQTTEKGEKRFLRRSGSLDFQRNAKNQDQQPKDDFSFSVNEGDKSPSQMGDNDFEQELKKIKDELVKAQKKKDEAEQVVDMDDILREKRKRIVVKMKNHQYDSMGDVLGERGEQEIDQLAVLVNKPQQKKNALQKLGQYKPKWEKKKVMPYQKKIKIQKKHFHEDLILNECQDSDDNQELILERLEEEYNVDHRSNIHVTGTLSIVINKPHHENKILNQNYYNNINPGRRITTIIEEPVQAFQISKEASDNDSVQMHPHSARSNTFQFNQSQELVPMQKLGETLRMRLRRADTKLSSGGQRRTIRLTNRDGLRPGSKPNSRLNSMNVSKNKGQTTNRSNKDNKSGRTGSVTSEQNTKREAVILPRPEVLTDKQILRRLNNEVKHSKVFSNIQPRNLPHKIHRRLGDQDLNQAMKKKKKKKKVITQHHQQSEGDGEYSESSQEQENNPQDYFLDREIDFKAQVQRAKSSALVRNIDNVEWSGQDIMQRFDPYKARIAINALSSIRVWPKGFYGYFKRWRVLLKRIMKSAFIDNLMTISVFANTITLAMDYYGIDPEMTEALTLCNTIFTIMFACEMGLKILSMGIVKYLRDRLNYMDGAIVILSLVELIFLSGTSALSALRSVRIIRTFRVLRVARLLRGLKSMMNIIAVIQRSISSFIYLAMLLIICIFIFALLGMQIYGGAFDFQDRPNRYNFDSFNNAFVTTFVLFSIENWTTVLIYAFGSTVSPFISAIYFISCIFIGNFMLLNLFLAILLDSFTAVEEEDHETAEKKKAREQQRLDDLKLKEGEDFIEGLDDIEMDVAQNKIGMKTATKKKKRPKKKQQNGDTQINNILDESIEIDIETLNEKKDEQKCLRQVLYKGIECERAVYIFPKESKIRTFIYKMVIDAKFESCIMILIALNSFKLIFDTYIQDLPEDDDRVYYSSQLDIVFTISFALEMLLKWVAFGFIMDKNSYIRESWNQLDCFIVVTSLIDASLVNVNMPIIKILRLLRILRPLRFISHNSSMKTVVMALLSSMGAIINVGIVVVVVFLMFAILGVNLFAGKLQYCTIDTYTVRNKQECFLARGEWTTFRHNFDSVPRAMMTLFVVANQEGWPDIMYQYCDIAGLEMGPKYGDTPLNAYFFMIFVFIGSYFFMNLFVGVLFMNFEAAQRDEIEALLLDGDEMKWVDMMKMILNSKPDIVKTPKNRISQFLYKYTKSDSVFDLFIMVCIILNMLCMALSFEGQTDDYSLALNSMNYAFTAIFTVEVVVKIIANGWAYFIPTWHKFDVFVVVASLFDIVLSQLSTAELKPLRVAPQLARVLRVMRVSRLFKLLNKARGLQALIQTITFSLPSLFNVFALLVLVYFIFAVLGVFMFRTITEGQVIDPVYMNFSNFSQALIILFRASTGEDWPTIMYDTMNTSQSCIDGVNCGTDLSPLFFISFIMICSYVMLNLFVLIILQQFELYYLPQDNILQQFKQDLDKFKITWIKFSKEFEGIKIRSLDLVVMFKDLDGNLGMKEESERTIMRCIVKMNLECDEEGFIYFNELLFKSMKRIYGKERTKKKILVEFELRALDRLQSIKNKQIMHARKMERQEAATVNPFLTMMYKNMSFKAWAKQFRMNQQRRDDEVEYHLDRDSSDEELNHPEEDEYTYETEQD